MGRWFGKALLQWQGAVEAVCDNLGGLWVHGHNGLHKENHRNGQKDLDPRPGVPAEWRWIWKLEQLLGKGAALSDHGSNPWEGEREREGEPKKRQRQGQRWYQPRDTQSTWRLATRWAANWVPQEAQKKPGICCSSAWQTMKKHLEKRKARSTSQSLPSKKRKHSFQSWKLHLVKWRNNLQKVTRERSTPAKISWKKLWPPYQKPKRKPRSLSRSVWKPSPRVPESEHMAESLQKGCTFVKEEITFAKGWAQRKCLLCVRLSRPLQCMCEHIYTFEKGGCLCKRGWQVDTPHTATLSQGMGSIF